MKFTLSWLKEHLETDADLGTITDTLTAIGLELEGVEDTSATLSPFTVAEILSAEKHPDADKLQVCKVATADGEKQIVCGAPNARAGIKVALAKEGVIIPNGGFKIKKSKIRGVESCGMLCSADELGLGEDSAGIIELPEGSQIGDSIVDVLGVNDPVMDIAITPNRGDCLGVYGIARDLAAAGMGTLKPLKSTSYRTHGEPPVKVHLKTNHCPMFVGIAIRGVKNGTSPEWLQRQLKAIGLRPISTLVDITNFFTHGYGRPLHVYDMAKLNGDIIVREAEAGEVFDALNDKSYTLKGGECVIADESGMLGLGGIVGGVPSSVTEETSDVLLECAWFDPHHIARVGRDHQIDTDARYRFERTVDPDFVVPGAQLAAQMIMELCGGEAYEPYVAGTAPWDEPTFPFDAEAINALGGTEIPAVEQQRILESLGFAICGELAHAPSWRPDIQGSADLAEEVLRIHGYDAIPAVPLPKSAAIEGNTRTANQQRIESIRAALTQNGILECHHFGFVSQEEADLFGGQDASLTLQNPISSELSVMRPSLMPHLLTAAKRNAARGLSTNALFEIGAQFSTDATMRQRKMATLIRCGSSETHWEHKSRTADVYDIKADALTALAAAGLDDDKLQIRRDAPAWYHPGRSGVLCLGPKTILAAFGELHPATIAALDIDFPVMAAEIYVDALPPIKGGKAKNKALQTSDYQASKRDFAFIVAEDVEAATLLKAIRGAEKQLIQKIELFDVYHGKGMEDGHKSLAYTVTLQAQDRTLKDAEIDVVSKAIVSAAEKAGAQLRA